MIEFFALKSKCDKNNFLDSAADMDIFDKIPVDLQTELYTKYVYRKFLDQFKQFFWFHKSVQEEDFRNRSKKQMV